MKLNDKVVVVTGAGSGIGQAVSLALLERGARVAAVDMRSQSLDETRSLAAAGARLSTHVRDVSDREAVQTLPDEVIAHHGVVDGLIHCAGIIQPFVPIAELDYEVIDRVIRVDLYGTIHMVKAFLPTLLDRPEAHLATVSSMGGFLPVPGQTLYGAAKAAVKLLTEGLYAELHDTGVRVSVILPGAVASNIAENSGVHIATAPSDDEEPREALPASEAARIILKGIEHDRLHILVGADARLMYLANRAAPRWATDLIRKQMHDLLERGAA